jgi:hypothetical protein
MTAESITASAEITEAGTALPEDSDEALKLQVLALSDKIAGLAAGLSSAIDDAATAQDVALGIKPYVDRLCALRRLLTPVGSIVEKRDQIEQLREDIAAEVAAVEDLEGALKTSVAPNLLSDLDSEIAAVKRDRKLHVKEVDVDEVGEPPTPAPTAALPRARQAGPVPLAQRPVQERLRLILGRRFVSVENLSPLLGGALDPELALRARQGLESVWRTVFEKPDLKPHVTRNRVKTLQSTFSDYALLFRPEVLDPGVPCTLEALRERCPSFFLRVSSANLWYTRAPFFRAPPSAPHWALVDRQYLNCTFKKPSIRLLMYARANELPPAMVRQRSLLEEVYDRVALGVTLRSSFFHSCNSITSTTYQQSSTAALKQAYVYEKEQSIRISGKRGTPHWRPTRPRWPGVYPSIVFPV